VHSICIFFAPENATQSFLEVPQMQAEQLMQRAIDLALLGLGKTYPNPVVGAVLADKDGQIIGEGFHQGAEHAEVLAIKNAGAIPAGATLFVTLEPCNHIGKTPPCTDAIIKAGIKNVVYAVKDPNPVAAGGADKLNAAGIKVAGGLLSDAAKAGNQDWLTKLAINRPRFVLKIAATLDGKVAAADGSSKWITSTQARADVAKLRSQSDAILTSTKTVIDDNPTLDSKGAGKNPYRIVMGTSEIDPTSNVFNNDASTELIKSQDFKELLNFVNQAGFNRVIVEAGPTFASALLTAGLVDEVILYLAPTIFGSGTNSIADLGITTISDRLDLVLIANEVIGVDIKLTYQIPHKEMAGVK
jgi:diaminohydroxyphosphoribosylaminopyrimidine deaminase/5-amino-6-(5-phosphoribosylamino)uracil reductase